MSRRGRSGPTISLFSFQDIITSVTAIVTVITLLLALDLVQRKQSQASASSTTTTRDVMNRLAAAENELARLKAKGTSTDDLIREVAAASPSELQREIEERNSQIQLLERQKNRLEQQAELWAANEKETLVDEFEVDSLKDRLKDIEKEIDDIKRQAAEVQAEDRPIFSLPKGVRTMGWVVEVVSSRISVARMGQPTKPTSFAATGLPIVGSSATDNFEKWIDERNLGSSYFFILVRPEGPHEFKMLQTMLLRKGIAFGFDVVDSKRAVLHPERGAAQ